MTTWKEGRVVSVSNEGKLLDMISKPVSFFQFVIFTAIKIDIFLQTRQEEMQVKVELILMTQKETQALVILLHPFGMGMKIYL